MAMRIFKSAIVGIVLAISLGALAYALAPLFDAVGLYAAPGGLLFPLVPNGLVYWIDPEGGPAAGVLLLMLCAGFFWTCLFGAAYFGWDSLRRRRPPTRH